VVSVKSKCLLNYGVAQDGGATRKNFCYLIEMPVINAIIVKNYGSPVTLLLNMKMDIFSQGEIYEV
jgi:hypothetical protein